MKKGSSRRDFIKASAGLGAGLAMWPTTSWSTGEKTDELDRMIGRLIMLNMYWASPPGFFTDLVEKYHLGGAYFDNNPLADRNTPIKASGKLRAAAPEPMVLVTDCEGGPVNKPRKIKSFDSAASVGDAYRAGELDGSGLYYKAEEKARLLKELGLNLNFDPVLDLAVPGSAIGERSYGQDPKSVAEIARTLVGAYKETGVGATAKHFPGLGSVKSDTHQVLPRLDKSVAELEAADLVPFRAAIETDVSAVMVAHVRVTAIDKDRPASLSPEVIGGLLRENLGFKGVVVSDSLTMGAVTKYYSGKGYTGDRALGRRCVDAIVAGCDMIFNFHTHPNKTPLIVAAVREAVKSKELPIKRIEEAAERVNALAL